MKEQVVEALCGHDICVDDHAQVEFWVQQLHQLELRPDVRQAIVSRPLHPCTRLQVLAHAHLPDERQQLRSRVPCNVWAQVHDPPDVLVAVRLQV